VHGLAVGVSIGRSVALRLGCGLWVRVGSRNHALKGGPDPHVRRNNFEAKRARNMSGGRHSLLKATQQRAEPVRRGRMDPDWGVLDAGCTLRHLANTIEPSVCGGDAALRQITLTTLVHITVGVRMRQTTSRLHAHACPAVIGVSLSTKNIRP